jgi:hypothetical protein
MDGANMNAQVIILFADCYATFCTSLIMQALLSRVYYSKMNMDILIFVSRGQICPLIG